MSAVGEGTFLRRGVNYGVPFPGTVGAGSFSEIGSEKGVEVLIAGTGFVISRSYTGTVIEVEIFFAAVCGTFLCFEIASDSASAVGLRFNAANEVGGFFLPVYVLAMIAMGSRSNDVRGWIYGGERSEKGPTWLQRFSQRSEFEEL